MYNSLLTAIENFNFILKTKFYSLQNFATCHPFNLCHVSNLYRTYHSLTLNFVEMGSHTFFKINLVIIYFIRSFDVYTFKLSISLECFYRKILITPLY